MANNIGITSLKLPRTIGDTVKYDTTDEWTSVTMITGELDLGCIVFDEDGTMGICSEFSRDGNENPIYTIRTSTLNTKIDVTSILKQEF
jgi:hypothetical protein